MYQKRITKEEIELLRPAAFEGEIVLIDDPAAIPAAVEELSTHEVVGVDTETRPSFVRGVRYQVALLQISTLSKCFLFRLNKTGMPDELAAFFANGKVKKVGLAFKDDLIGLTRLHRFQSKNCIDLQNMVNDYGIFDLGLQKIFAIVFQAKMSKAQRLTNWENEVLTPQQCSYAATDAWGTLLVYEQLVHSEKLSPAEVIALKAEELALQIAASNAQQDAHRQASE